MSKKYFSILLAPLFLALVFEPVFFSQAESLDSDEDGVLDENDNCKSIANFDQNDFDADGIGDWCEEDAERFGFEMKAGYAPDSLFYFLDSLGEKFGLFFTFNSEKKALKALGYAKEKLAEMHQMMAAGNEKAAKKASDRYALFMGVVKTRTDSLQKTEAFSPVIVEAIKLINAQEDLVKQYGKEKWREIEDNTATIQADFMSDVDVPPFAIAAPLALSREERRERLCVVASGRKIKDETSKLFDTLCSAEFSADMSLEDKKTILYSTLFEVMSRNDISDRVKILLHQIIFTHLPEEEESRVGGVLLRKILASMAGSESKLFAQGDIFDPSFPPQEAGSQAREDRAVREMEQAVRKIRDNCPAPGYSSYAFWVACSIHDFVTGDMYSDEYAESGGPCKYNEMGSVESTHIQSEVSNYSGSQQEAGADGAMKPKRSREVSCSVACASHNCGQYEDEQTAQKGCENPAVYYIMGSKMSEEILLDMCTGRGVSDKIVPKEKTGLIGGLVKGIGKLFGGGEEGVIAREDLGNGYERVITRKNCELFNCSETELEFSWGKEKVKSCCCSCAPNDETHRFRKMFDDWDWSGDNLLDRFLSRKQDILKKLEGLRDAFQPSKPVATDAVQQPADQAAPGEDHAIEVNDTVVVPDNTAIIPTPPSSITPAAPSAEANFFWLEMPADLGTHKVGESFSTPVNIHRRTKTSYTMNGKSLDRVLVTKRFSEPRLHGGVFEAGPVLSPSKIFEKPPMTTAMPEDKLSVAGTFTCAGKGEGDVVYKTSVFYDYYDEVDKGFDADKPSTTNNAATFYGSEILQAKGKVRCVEEEAQTLPTGDYIAPVYHKCGVTEGKNVDGVFEANLRAEVSVPTVRAGGQVIYDGKNQIETRKGLCRNEGDDVPICQDPRYNSDGEYSQSKSFTYTEEYKYPANVLASEIDRVAQDDMAIMTSGVRTCAPSESGGTQVQEDAIGSFEFLDSSNWQPRDNVKVPGDTHVIVASDGTPDIRTFLPIDLVVKGADGVVWYTYFIADNPINCRGADGCSRNISIGAENSGKPFTLEARGDNGELLAKHSQ